MRKTYSVSLDDSVVSQAEKVVKQFGFKNFSRYLEYCLSIVNSQDKQSFQVLNHFRDIEPGKFFQILLLDHCAKTLAEVEVCGELQDGLFYFSPDGNVLTGEKYLRVRYAKHKQAYLQASTFKKQIDDCAASVAADQAIAEVEENLSKRGIE